MGYCALYIFLCIHYLNIKRKVKMKNAESHEDTLSKNIVTIDFLQTLVLLNSPLFLLWFNTILWSNCSVQPQ